MSLETEIKLRRPGTRAASATSRWCPAASSSPPPSADTAARKPPPIVAVELPGFLADAYAKALARLPEISVILYSEEAGPNTQQRPATTKTIAPSTSPSSRPIRSPKRCARREEIGAEVIFLEPDSNDRPHLARRLSGHLFDPPHRP